MISAQGLLPLAVALLSFAAPVAHGAGAGSIGPASTSLAPTLAVAGQSYDAAGPVAVLSWRSLYAKYHAGAMQSLPGVGAVRSTGYLDVGVKRELGGAVALNLHAGDGRVSGPGGFNWRDLNAGLSQRLRGGWVLAGSYSRAFGATGASAAFESHPEAMPRTEPRPLQGRGSHGAVVLTFGRRF
jgi:hypothetical protein